MLHLQLENYGSHAYNPFLVFSSAYYDRQIKPAKKKQVTPGRKKYTVVRATKHHTPCTSKQRRQSIREYLKIDIPSCDQNLCYRSCELIAKATMRFELEDWPVMAGCKKIIHGKFTLLAPSMRKAGYTCSRTFLGLR